jgi:hypothetical protein
LRKKDYCKDGFLVHVLEQITHAQHHDLMIDYQDALATIMQADGVEHTPKPQDHVTPALACRRPEVELAEQTAGGCVLGKTLLYPEPGQTVQNSEFFFRSRSSMTNPKKLFASPEDSWMARRSRVHDDRANSVRSPASPRAALCEPSA